MIRLFIGTSPNHEDAEFQSVVEWTARKNCSQEIEIYWLKMEREGPLSGWDTSLWATPFTSYRFAVPELCGFEGRAIYCDVDFMFFGDIAELWNQEIPSPAVGLARSPKRMCTFLWDCSRARLVLPSISKMKKDGGMEAKRLFWSQPDLIRPFEGTWNCLDGEDLPISDIKALHFTRMATQPHLIMAWSRLSLQGRSHWFDGTPRCHPRRDLVQRFRAELDEAEKRGYGVSRYTSEPCFGLYTKRLVGDHEAVR
jgi:hypothetical protein